jgi:hypothetical protein
MFVVFGDGMKWKRTAYFLVGAVFTPIFLGLTVLCLTALPRNTSAVAVYGVSAFFLAIAAVTASAFRAAFRTPPWWIISPEKTRQSTILLIRSQMSVLLDKRIKLAEKNVKICERNLKLATLLDQLEAAKTHEAIEGEIGGEAPPH